MNAYFKILLTIGISVVILQGASVVIESGYIKYYGRETYKFDELLNNERQYDIIFIGSSRTCLHVNPLIIDSITQLKSFNFGIDGGTILESNLYLNAYLEHHPKPKMAVLDVAIFQLCFIEELAFDNSPQYLPYLNDPVVYEALQKTKKMVWAEKYFPIQKLTEYDDYKKINALKGFFGKSETENNNYRNLHGYKENSNDTIPLPCRLIRPIPIPLFNKVGKELYIAMLEKCKKENIKLIVTYPPEYYKADYTGCEPFFDFLTKTCAEYSATLINYRNTAITKDHKLFANIGHLNVKGATVYSQLLGAEISIQLKNKFIK